MRQSSVGTDRLPAWLSCDLHKLRDDDVTTQLEMIFGEEEAQQILNPTVKRSKHQSNQHVLQPAIAKHETQDAHMLWNSLRGISNKKLASQMSANNDTEYIQQNVRFDNNNNNNNNNSWSSRRVDLYRQRVQLMHKVAHMNEEKTKQLLETVKLPALTSSGVDYKWTENCEGYLAEYEIERMETSRNITSPLSTTESVPHGMHSNNIRMSNNSSSKSDRMNYNNVRISSSNSAKSHGMSPDSVRINSSSSTNIGNSLKVLKFVSENDCSTNGKFSDRMKRLGIDSNVGIGMSQLQQKPLHSISAVHVRTTTKDWRQDISNETGKSKRKAKTCCSWQPLSLAALAEYTRHMNAPGAGKFKSGQKSFWKPEVFSGQSKKMD